MLWQGGCVHRADRIMRNRLAARSIRCRKSSQAEFARTAEYDAERRWIVRTIGVFAVVLALLSALATFMVLPD